jgi:hypothetical protein
VIEATTQSHHGTPSDSRDAESATTAEDPAQDPAEPQESAHGDGGLIEPSFGPCETATACATANNPASPLISEHLDGDGVGHCLAVEATPLEATVDTNQSILTAGDGTRSRRIRKSRVINLRACICGIDVSEADIQAGEKVMQCKVPGCETVWVCHDLHFGLVMLA